MRQAAALLLTVLSACGDTPAQTFTWVRDSHTLVASKGIGGGMVKPTPFGERRYGRSFVRLMGDGWLFHGAPDNVKKRKLTDAEIQELLNAMEAGRFASYEASYQHFGVADAGTTTLTVSLETIGTHKVSAYALDYYRQFGQDPGYPSGLYAADDALDAAAKQQSDKHVADKIRVASMKLNGAIADSVTKDWPLAKPGLSSVEYDPQNGTWDRAAELDREQDIDAVLALLPPGGYANSQTKGAQRVLFRDGGEVYEVFVCHVLP